MSPAGRRWVDRFLALLGQADEPLPPATAPPPGLAARADDDHAAARATLEARLREMLAARKAGSAGRITLLDMSQLKERYRERWPVLSQKLDQLIGMTLARRLGPHDVFARCGEGLYAILFDGLPEAEAKLKCALIAEELFAKLTGQDPSVPPIEIASAAVGIDQRVEVQHFTKLQALEELLQSVDQYIAGRAPPGAAAPALSAVSDLLEVAGRDLSAWESTTKAGGPAAAAGQADYIRDLLGHADAVLRERQAAQNRSLLIDQEQRAGSSAADLSVVLGDMQQALGRLIERSEAEMGAQRRAARLDEAALESAQVIVRYQPAWHVTGKVIANHRCLIGLTVDGGELLDRAMLPEQAEPKLIAMVDRLCLRKAIDAARLLIQRRQQTTIGVPVHHATLMRMAHRQSYLDLCRDIDPEIRKLLVWEIIDPVIGFANSYLPAAVSLLQRFGRAVTVQVMLDHARFDELAGIGIYAVGCDLTMQSGREAAQLRQLELFRSRSERHGLKAFVHGVTSLSATTAAVFAGFEYIAGPAIAELTESPEPVVFFDTADLYRRAYPSDDPGI